MKIAHIIVNMSNNWGGPPKVFQGLTEALVKKGIEVTIFAPFKKEEMHNIVRPRGANIQLFKQSFFSKIWAGQSFDLVKTLNREIANFDLIHIHEIWHYPGNFRNKSILDKNKELKNKYLGERCFIIGLGPSINQQDLTKLKNEYVFACNHFYLHRQLNIIKPAFYSLIEPIILNDSFREEVFPKTIERINFYASKNNKAVFLFNIQYKKYIEDNNLFSGNNVYYFLFSGSISNRMNLDMSKPNPSGTGSIFFLLSLAKYLGFKAIYIIGCDYDYILTKDEKHFYKEEISCSSLKGETNLVLAKHLYTYLKRMDIMNKCIQKEGVQVFNAGIGGMTDTFPRVDYNSLFKA